MPMRRDVYPLEIALPDGRRAEYVSGTRPPRYTIGGELTEIDVTIPDDLAATGWYWSGSFLYQPWPERPETGPGVAISTGTYGLPPYTEGDRGSVWDTARNLDALRVQVREQRKGRPAKKAPPKRQPKIAPAKVEPEQMELAL